MALSDELLDKILAECDDPEKDLLSKDGLVKQLTKRLIERAMDGELTHQLGYTKHSPEGKNTGNSRNGKGKKTLMGDQGEMTVKIPRDRNGEYEPKLIKKHQKRFDGFDDKIISMYARGMSTRDMTAHLKEMYGVDVSADFISTVTDAVIDEVKEWQSRPLEPLYPIVYLDALVLKVRTEGKVVNKSAYLAIGINMEGLKDVLGIWLAETEGAKFWLNILTEIKNRGVQDILIASVDGLKGFPDAIGSVFPQTEVQLCIVHMVRNSLKYVSWKDRKQLAADLKAIYQSATEDAGREELTRFSEKWDSKFPMISKSWESHWSHVVPFFAYPQEIRRLIYTTNAIESLNYTLRKAIKTKASFPNDESALKMLYLALKNAAKKWTMPVRDWGKIIGQLTIRFKERITLN
jgi:putative transposase